MLKDNARLSINTPVASFLIIHNIINYIYIIGQVVTLPIIPSNLITYSITIDDLDNAYNNAISKGHPPKAIIITNPNNPLGKIYTKNELLIFINYCNMKSIHLIVDEIYALSVFDNDVNNDDKFQSVTTILENKLNDNVHVIWGLSKDFGVSGLRAGFLYTQNKLLLASLSNFNMAFEVSNIVQEIYEDILSDHTFIKDYLALNSKLIQESYVLLTTGLNKLKIPFFHCHAGIFLFVDMSHLLKGNFINTLILLLLLQLSSSTIYRFPSQISFILIVSCIVL